MGDNFQIGAINSDQLVMIVDRFDLGMLKHARPTTGGTSATTLDLETDRGRFVLRTHRDVKTLQRERIHADLIETHTRMSGPWPYEIDDTRSIIPTPYAVMSRLSGYCPADLRIWKQLDSRGRSELTRAFGKGLRDLHALKVKQPGYFTGDHEQFEPFAQGYPAWQLERVNSLIHLWRACKPGPSSDDLAWAGKLLDQAVIHLSIDFEPVYVHHDYTLSNVLVQRVDGRIAVTGVVDLMEGYFALGEADLVRTIAMFGLEHPHRISEFLSGYLSGRQLPPGHTNRFALYMLEDRLTVWLADRRAGSQQLPNSFRVYAEPYLQISPFGDRD